MRKRKKLVRVAVAIAMLAIFVLPSAAQAFPVADSDTGKGRETTSGGFCAGMDPAARAMDSRICNDTRQAPSGETNFEPVDTNPVQVPTSSGSDGIDYAWYLIAALLVAGGGAGLILSLRHGPRTAH